MENLMEKMNRSFDEVFNDSEMRILPVDDEDPLMFLEQNFAPPNN